MRNEETNAAIDRMIKLAKSGGMTATLLPDLRVLLGYIVQLEAQEDELKLDLTVAQEAMVGARTSLRDLTDHEGDEETFGDDLEVLHEIERLLIGWGVLGEHDFTNPDRGGDDHG